MNMFKGVNRTFGKYEFRAIGNAQWLKIFYHNSANGAYFPKYEEFMNNVLFV